MTGAAILSRIRESLSFPLPLPGQGQTGLRHQLLMDIGRDDLSLARLAEAHWDAVAILAEAGRQPEPGAIYGVWASEAPSQSVTLRKNANGRVIDGSKMFCSGAGLIDRTLLTVGSPEPLLLELDLRTYAGTIRFDHSVWKTLAFAETQTATVTFIETPVSDVAQVGGPGWYLQRPGFWHGACGPAACWAGGAWGLFDYAARQTRNDPHTLAHMGAMYASIWAARGYLQTAGWEIDQKPGDIAQAHVRALTVRHRVEQTCTEVLLRLPRAYGPHPLAMDEELSRRFHELNLYIRQSHAERDLESLGRLLMSSRTGTDTLLR